VQAGEESDGCALYAAASGGRKLGFAPASILVGAGGRLAFADVVSRAAISPGNRFWMFAASRHRTLDRMTFSTRTDGSLLIVMLIACRDQQYARHRCPGGEDGGSSRFELARVAIGWLTLVILWLCAGYFSDRHAAWANGGARLGAAWIFIASPELPAAPLLRARPLLSSRP